MMDKYKEYKYKIGTNSRLLVEFAQCPEGMAIILLVVILPFWGISWLTRYFFKVGYNGGKI